MRRLMAPHRMRADDSSRQERRGLTLIGLEVGYVPEGRIAQMTVLKIMQCTTSQKGSARNTSCNGLSRSL